MFTARNTHAHANFAYLSQLSLDLHYQIQRLPMKEDPFSFFARPAIGIENAGLAQREGREENLYV